MNGNKSADAPGTGRLTGLLQMLETDPRNLALLADAAETALDDRRPDITADLLDRYSEISPLSPRETNLAGLAAMQSGQFETAVSVFAQLIDAGVEDRSVRFNLAWSLAMLKDFEGARAHLGEEIARELPQAAMLEVQILHQTGDFEVAAEKARSYIEQHPDHRGLMAAVSVLALDVEDTGLAAHCAAKAGDHPDGLATLGTLALEDRPSEALDFFDRALAWNEQVPRAWVGRGLAKLLTGDAEGASADIDRGAEMFDKHLGSWIAAGWAHFVNRDMASSRQRFETALDLDSTFAESHGALAVLDILDGRIDEGRARSEIALRLDRNCYSGALAKVLLTAATGDAAGARKIFDLAINMPVDASGRTIAEALAKLGMGGS